MQGTAFVTIVSPATLHYSKVDESLTSVSREQYQKKLSLL